MLRRGAQSGAVDDGAAVASVSDGHERCAYRAVDGRDRMGGTGLAMRGNG